MSTVTTSNSVDRAMGMASTDAEPGLVKALLHARESVMRQLRPVLRSHGLTEQQWRVMDELMVAEELSASELAARTCLRASSLSRIIKDLEKRDYLSRRSQMEDLRRTLVSMTNRGRSTMRGLSSIIGGIYEDIGGRFGATETEGLRHSAWALSESLGGAGEPDED